MDHDAYLTCPSGHLLNESYHLDESRRPLFCPQCGQPTFHECPNCKTKIPGISVQRVRDGFMPVYSGGLPELPSYCAGCGTALPWTTAADATQGMFRQGQQFDAFKRIVEIVGRARQVLRVADNWIDVSVLDSLSSKQPQVGLEILTKKAPPDLKPAVAAFGKQHGPIEVRITLAFHDRFIFVDDREVWAFGASLKDAGKSVTFYARIVEPSAVKALEAAFQSAWAAGKAL